jgi:hypothetical protein
LLTILDRHVKAQSACDLGNTVKKLAMDDIPNLTFGDDFEYLEGGTISAPSPLVISSRHISSVSNDKRE